MANNFKNDAQRKKVMAKLNGSDSQTSAGQQRGPLKTAQDFASFARRNGLSYGPGADVYGEFMAERFGDRYTDPGYAEEWVDRFKSGVPQTYMDDRAREAYDRALGKFTFSDSGKPSHPQTGTTTSEEAKDLLFKATKLKSDGDGGVVVGDIERPLDARDRAKLKSMQKAQKSFDKEFIKETPEYTVSEGESYEREPNGD